MTAELTPRIISIDNFIASKQIQLFQDLKQDHFSGQIVFRDYQGTEWNFNLYLGRILYVTGGSHSVRRWRRHLTYYFPQIAARLEQELKSFKEFINQEISIPWDYHLLCFWLERKKINHEQATKMIRGMTAEVLFDITQAKNITYCLKPEEEPIKQRLTMLDAEQQIIAAWKQWQAWQQLRIVNFLPNLAPVIKNPEILQDWTSEKIYQSLSKLLEKKYTFRDLAVHKQCDLILTARSIIPYIQLGLLELVEIPDLPCPIIVAKQDKKKLAPAETIKTINTDGFASFSTSLDNQEQPLIACVETNHTICHILKKIIMNAGYGYISYSDPLQAIALLLDSNPDLIFVNSQLTAFSGYDLCTELRQLDYFEDTPIVLYSKNINLLDRIKAKMAGCSEFLSKPLEAQSILETIDKYF